MRGSCLSYSASANVKEQELVPLSPLASQCLNARSVPNQPLSGLSWNVHCQFCWIKVTAGYPHALKALTRFKMILTMIRS